MNGIDGCELRHLMLPKSEFQGDAVPNASELLLCQA
jgi:hypothetical protein